MGTVNKQCSFFSGYSSVLDVVKTLAKDSRYDKPFFVCDLADVENKIQIWKQKLPRVHPYYAVKANPDPVVLRLMVLSGLSFDCASKGEIATVLSQGVEPQDIIYAHPYKFCSHLRYATDQNVDLMTFDSVFELQKIKEICPEARQLLRFEVPNVKASFPLSDKFGCGLDECTAILEEAARLKIQVVGTTFHVGSMCEDPSAFETAIGMSRKVFDIAEKMGFTFSILDLGGGYPGHNGSYKQFEEICECINNGLEEYFPKRIYRNLRVIAEPGTFMVGSAFTLCTTVIGKRLAKVAENGNIYDDAVKEVMFYYLNEGIYGSFSLGWKCYGYEVQLLFNQEEINKRQKLKSKVWGCSACSADLIFPGEVMPEMEIGERVLIQNMGSYTIPVASTFNGFEKADVYYSYTTDKTSDYCEASQGCDEVIDWQNLLKGTNIIRKKASGDSLCADKIFVRFKRRLSLAEEMFVKICE